LVAVVGLAIDGGQLYNSRRIAQKAADASALAGTRTLGGIIKACTSVGTAQDSAVTQSILDFARSNGVVPNSPTGRVEAWYVNKDGTVLGNVGTGTIPHGATGVQVSIVITGPATFTRIIGQQDLVVTGQSTAMTGKITQFSGAGILPIAVPDEVVASMIDGDDFMIGDGGAYCRNENSSCVGNTNDPNSQRGWLNFYYMYNIDHLTAADPLRRTHKESLGASDLAGFINGTIPVPPIFLGTPPIPPAPAQPVTVFPDGDFIDGTTGEKQGDLKAIYDTYAGQEVYLPVFDVVYSPPYMYGLTRSNGTRVFPDPCTDQSCSGGKQRWPNQSDYMYHIIGFAAVDVCDQAANPSQCRDQKNLRGTFKEVIIGDAQIQPSDGIGTCPANLLMFSVSLWK
jgi:hypothetical protein